MTIEVFIPKWRPASNNALVGKHWSVVKKIKGMDKAAIAAAFCGKPKATGKRMVSMHITLAGRQKMYDNDNGWKSLLDALVSFGMLVDDSPEWVKTTEITYDRGENAGTLLTLSDID